MKPVSPTNRSDPRTAPRTVPAGDPPAALAQRRYVWAIQTCRSRQLRLTHAREHILHYLAGQPAPVTWETLTHAPELAGCCDPATISRTLALLRDAQLVRQIRLPNRTSCFLLNAPGPQPGLLICRRCGSMTPVALPTAVVHSMQSLARDRGFSWSNPEIICHGHCAGCSAELARSPPPTKLAPARARK